MIVESCFQRSTGVVGYLIEVNLIFAPDINKSIVNLSNLIILESTSTNDLNFQNNCIFSVYGHRQICATGCISLVYDEFTTKK